MEKVHKVTLKGKEYTLKCDLNALYEIEVLTGRNALTENIFKGLRATDMRAMLYVFLKPDNPEITIDQVGHMVEPKDMTEITEILIYTFHDSIPKADPDAKKKEVPGE